MSFLRANSAKDLYISFIKGTTSTHSTFNFMNPCSCFLKSRSSVINIRKFIAFLYTACKRLVTAEDIFSICNIISICPIIKVKGVRNSCDILVKKRNFILFISSIRIFSSFSFTKDKDKALRLAITRQIPYIISDTIIK